MGIDPHGEIVDEIIDNDLEENIWNKFINIFKGPVDLKEKGKKKNNILHFLVLKNKFERHFWLKKYFFTLFC